MYRIHISDVHVDQSMFRATAVPLWTLGLRHRADPWTFGAAWDYLFSSKERIGAKSYGYWELFTAPAATQQFLAIVAELPPDSNPAVRNPGIERNDESGCGAPQRFP